MRKEIKKDNERTWYLIKEWQTRAGLKARVHQCVWADLLKGLAPTALHDFYTGYVDVTGKTGFNEDELEVHGGVTFRRGELMDLEGEWVGFDMAHFGDEGVQSLIYAVEECEKLAEQIK